VLGYETVKHPLSGTGVVDIRASDTRIDAPSSFVGLSYTDSSQCTYSGSGRS
jgi:hypothetical protein